MEVESLLGLLFWLLNRASSSFCRSPARPLFSAASKRIHRWTIIFSKRGNELRRGPWKIEAVGVLEVRDVFLWHPRGGKSLHHVSLNSPGHRADKAFWRRRRVRRADFQDLSHQCRIVWNPVSHRDPPAGPGHPHHLLGDIKGFGGEHCAKNADDEIEAEIFEIVEIGGVAFLKLAVRQALLDGALSACRDEIACYIDAQHLGAEPCLRQGRRPVAASQIPHLEPLCDSERFHERLPARSHRCRNAGKIAFFPKCLVRIHGKSRFCSSAALAIASVRSA